MSYLQERCWRATDSFRALSEAPCRRGSPRFLIVPIFPARNERHRLVAVCRKNKTKENAGGSSSEKKMLSLNFFTIGVDARQRRDDGDGLLGLLAAAARRRGLLRACRRRRRRDFGHGGFCGRGHLRFVKVRGSLGVVEEEEELRFRGGGRKKIVSFEDFFLFSPLPAFLSLPSLFSLHSPPPRLVVRRHSASPKN